ncbi:hypothetical protein Poli38472_008104 [Pythium oligandrum]|uniref:Uncharacterized protein n=1 Tax=Pythium oligandrum TaxID=41045 RepID=A0A8K1FN34_PYTOL|nr:hypothetical protein Poli38472_008104 [Pythium oligandrum]|eukprot:TMW65462.1 hypothetical protein Poli38472_008104 [Pythium oligandrum]
MTISNRVHSSFFTSAELIRLPPTVLQHYEERQMIHGKHQVPVRRVNLWSREEHERFLQGLELYPQGPWKLIAAMVGTKTTRQTMTHAQKYRQKINRRQKMQSVMLRTQPLEDNEMDALPSLETVVKEMIELMPLPEPDMLPRLLPVSVAPVNLPKMAIGDVNVASSAPMHDIRSPQEVNQVLDFPLFDAELDELLSGLEPLPVVW